MAARITRPIEATLRTDLITLLPSKWMLPCLAASSRDLLYFSSAAALSRLCVSVRNQLEDSTFASVRKPRTMGRVVVGSAWDRLLNVRKDSESNGVGDCERWPKTTEETKNKGSCVTTGTTDVSRGRQLCCLNRFFSLADIYYTRVSKERNKQTKRTAYWQFVETVASRPFGSLRSTWLSLPYSCIAS